MTAEYKKLLNMHLKFKGMFYNGICPKCAIQYSKGTGTFFKQYTI